MYNVCMKKAILSPNFVVYEGCIVRVIAFCDLSLRQVSNIVGYCLDNNILRDKDFTKEGKPITITMFLDEKAREFFG